MDASTQQPSNLFEVAEMLTSITRALNTEMLMYVDDAPVGEFTDLCKMLDSAHRDVRLFTRAYYHFILREDYVPPRKGQKRTPGQLAPGPQMLNGVPVVVLTDQEAARRTDQNVDEDGALKPQKEQPSKVEKTKPQPQASDKCKWCGALRHAKLTDCPKYVPPVCVHCKANDHISKKCPVKKGNMEEKLKTDGDVVPKPERTETDIKAATQVRQALTQGAKTDDLGGSDRMTDEVTKTEVAPVGQKPAEKAKALIPECTVCFARHKPMPSAECVEDGENCEPCAQGCYKSCIRKKN